MKENKDTCNQLREVRTRLGLSQQTLAQAAGVASQTISGIEAGLYSASATVALRLAKALGCRVEDLFWLEDDAPTVQAQFIGQSIVREGQRVSLTQMDGRWIATPLQGDSAFRMEMIPADGITSNLGADGTVTVDLLDEMATLQRAVVIAGCAPALSLWTRSAERWYPGLRVNWTHANSSEALRLLSLGHVHIAGVHLHDSASGEDNGPFVRRMMPGQPVVLVNFGIWEEGLLVAEGNPKKIINGKDLVRRNVKVVNREPGAGSRLLLDALLRESGLKASVVRGYDHQVLSHQEVAQAVAAGEADGGISTASVAAAYGLGFVGIRKVRYDLALRKEQYQQEPIQQLLNTLNHRWVRSQLQVLGGYDITRTGQVVAET